MIASADRTAQVALYNYALGGIETALGTTIIMHEAGPGGTEAVVSRNTNTHRTTYEIKLPAASLGLTAPLTGGIQFGLGMAINDGDQLTPGQKGWGGLGAHAIVFGKTPQETALMTLKKYNDIEPGKDTYTATAAKGGIAVDGSLSEWLGVPVLADPKFSVPKGSGATNGGTYVLFEEYNGGTWTGPDDQTSAVQIVYDADNVYFGFVVTDEYHENSANSAWNGDSVQLMIADAYRTNQIALYNYALGGIETALGSTIVMHEAGPGGTTATVLRDRLNHKTIYEIKLPAASLGLTAPLTAGQQFGLGMAINDGDQLTPGQKGWGGLGAHAIVFGKTPQETALVTLGTGGGGGALIFLSAITPGVNTFKFRASDFGSSIVDPATAKLWIDGTLAPLVASPKVLDATDFTFTRSSPFPAGSHTYAIEVRDTLGHIVTDSGSFISAVTPVLTALQRATSVNASKPGFIWRVFQNENAHTTPGLTVAEYLAEAELALKGMLPDGGGGFLANFAESNNFGATLSAGVIDGPLLKFEITNVVYLNQLADGVNGNPAPPNLITNVPADQMPGVPGQTGSDDGIDAEIRTFVEFPAGVTRLGISCNDHFRIHGGLINNLTNGATFIGEGVGVLPVPSPIIKNIFVETAGIYPLRVVYQELNLGAWITLYTVKPDGDSVLLGDVANGGLRTYREGVVPGPAFYISVTRAGALTTITWTEPGAVLQQSSNLTTWTDLPGATSPYTVPSGPAKVFYRLKK
jgi:hypothetical protein